MIMLRIQISVLFISGIFSKSIQNVTADGVKIQALEETIESMQSQIVNLTKTVQVMQGTKEDNGVMFYARMSSSRTMNTNAVVRFNDIRINKGGHYSGVDGIFIAPVSGIYQFAWTTFTDSGAKVYTELRVGNSLIDRLDIQLGGSTGIIPATRVALCSVTKGDHVWIQTSSVYSNNYFRVDYAYSSFMGLLVHKT